MWVRLNQQHTPKLPLQTLKNSNNETNKPNKQTQQQKQKKAATDPNLAIKQLRYFARFVIICLLLNRRDEVWQLLQEFQALISAYVMKYKPPDSAEWRGVINEITVFLNADVAMPVPRAPGQAVPFRVSLRAAPNQQEVKVAAHQALLADAVLVAYAPRQVCSFVVFCCFVCFGSARLLSLLLRPSTTLNPLLSNTPLKNKTQKKGQNRRAAARLLPHAASLGVGRRV